MLLKLSLWCISVIVGKHQIERVESSKSLVLTIDVNLAWEKHIDEILKKVSGTKLVIVKFRKDMLS